MIFSTLFCKKQNFLFVLILIASLVSFGQRSQRIAYIDMEYILEKVPEYKKAEQTLEGKVSSWRTELDKIAREIEKLKTDLATEREILTASLIVEKEDAIDLKQKELREKEEEYFGANGSMFLFRKRIIQPVQDVVYNAIQEIAKKKKYDFVLDKSSDLIMLYSNKKYDISEPVLKRIQVGNKRKEKKKKGKKDRKGKQDGNKSNKDVVDKDAPNDDTVTIADDNITTANETTTVTDDSDDDVAKDKTDVDVVKSELTEAQKKKLEAKKAIQKKKEQQRLAKKKAIEERRAKRKAEIEAKRAILRKKKQEAEARRKEKEKQDKEGEEENKKDNKENN